MKKRTSLHIGITVAMLLIILPNFAGAANGFFDVHASHANADAIEYVQTHGIVHGYPNGTFKPDNQINRAEFTKIIVGSVFSASEINQCNFYSFTDVPGTAWYAPYVCMAKQKGIVGGYPDGRFRPERTISFVEAAKIIVMAMTMERTDEQGDQWYAPYVRSIQENKAIPTSIRTLDKFITRGEMAEMIYRLLAEVTNKPYVVFQSVLPSAFDDTSLLPSSSVSPPSSPPSTPTTCAASIGMNIEHFDPWTTGLMFADGMKYANPWIPQPAENPDYIWDSEVEVPVGADGYPTHVPFTAGSSPQVVKTFFLNNEGDYPSGTYAFSFEGTGEINFGWDAGEQSFTQAGTYQVQINNPDEGVYIEIRQSSAGDPIRNMKFLLPVNSTGPFNSTYTQQLAPFSVIRPMQTSGMQDGEYPCDNGVNVDDPTCVMYWSSRTKPSDFSQVSPRGIALEYLIDLANEAGSDFWANIIHAADDDYVRQYARLVRDRLNANHKVYIELSNEVWNTAPAFPQSYYFQDKGMLVRPDPEDEYNAGRRYFVQRSLEIFRIFEEEFSGQTHRLVKVLPSQAGNPWITWNLLEHTKDPVTNPHGISVDAVAIAPYFGGDVADNIIRNGELNSISVDEILDRAEDDLNTTVRSWMEEAKQYIDQYNAQTGNDVIMIAYEGGQHLVSVENMDNKKLTDLLVAANRDPRMYNLVQRLLDVWYESGGDVHVFYNFTDPSTKWGSWGVLERTDQPISEAHKYRALVEYQLQACPETS